MRIIRNNTNQREYILQKELGRGSYGTVYYSELYPSKQPCAIKKIEVRAQYRHAIYN
jgi:serine/threonine protein kinase